MMRQRKAAKPTPAAEFVGPPKPPPTAAELATQARGEFQKFLDRRKERLTGAVKAFRDKVAEPDGSVDYAARWGIKEAVEAEHAWNRTANLNEILAGRGEPRPDLDKGKLLEHAREETKRLTRELLSEDRYYPNCTCPVVNLFRLFEQKACQENLRFYRAVEFWLTYIAELDGLPPDQPGPFRYPSYEFGC